MVSLKEVLLRGLDRILQRPPETHVAIGCATAGASLISSPLVETLLASYLKSREAPVLSSILRLLSFSDNLQVFAGIILLLIAIFIVYTTSISPKARRTTAIRELSSLRSNPASAPSEIQNAFGRIYGYEPDIDVIEALESSKRGKWASLDHKYGRNLVVFHDGTFLRRDSAPDFDKRIGFFSTVYWLLAIPAILLFSVGINIATANGVRFLLVFLSVFLGIGCAMVAHSLRAYSSAKRLV